MKFKPTRQDIDDLNGFNDGKDYGLSEREVLAIRRRLKTNYRELLGSLERKR